MGYFPVRYDSRVVIYEHKLFIRLDTDKSTKVGAVRIDIFLLVWCHRSHFKISGQRAHSNQNHNALFIKKSILRFVTASFTSSR